MGDVVSLSRRVSLETARRIRTWLDTAQPIEEAQAEAYVTLLRVAHDLGLADVSPESMEGDDG